MCKAVVTDRTEKEEREREQRLQALLIRTLGTFKEIIQWPVHRNEKEIMSATAVTLAKAFLLFLLRQTFMPTLKGVLMGECFEATQLSNQH